jgi:predicted nucleic acid-binding protein
VDRSSRLLVDSGPLVAYIDRRDPDHAACLALLRAWSGSLTVPLLAVAEVSHLIERRLQRAAEVLFLGDIIVGNLIPEPVHASDWLRIAELVEQYSDLPLGTVDASVVAAAERLGVSTIATLDRRHFSVVRPMHVESFDLVP